MSGLAQLEVLAWQRRKQKYLKRKEKTRIKTPQKRKFKKTDTKNDTKKSGYSPGLLVARFKFAV